MITQKIAIPNYRKKTPVFSSELRAVNVATVALSITAPVISMSEKKEVEGREQEVSEPGTVVLPSVLHAYLKGRDNDPL